MKKIISRLIKSVIEMAVDAGRMTYLDFGFRTQGEYDIWVRRAEAVSAWIRNDGKRHLDVATLATIQQYYDRYLYCHHSQHEAVDHVLEVIQNAISTRVSELEKEERRSFADAIIQQALKN